MNNNQNEIVYVLSNPAMPGLIKIGKTTQTDLNSRMKQLYTTGVPFPFECEYACEVLDCHKVEKAFHTAFGKTRVNPGREFFEIEAERVKAVLELVAVNDLTPQVEALLNEDVSYEEKASVKRMKLKRPPMNFFEMGIEAGSELLFKDGKTIAIVEEPKKVRFNDETLSLTALTMELLNIEYSVQPSPYWTYGEKTLHQIYDETYTVDRE